MSQSSRSRALPSSSAGPVDPHGALDIKGEYGDGVWSYYCPGCWKRHVYKPEDLIGDSPCDSALIVYRREGAIRARKHWLEITGGEDKSLGDVVRDG